jgi:hypothetical protein
VFRETAHRFDFAVRGLSLDGDRPAFYIKPADGFALPGIMKWLKQTFAQRYKRDKGRTWRLCVDRYRSLILEGEPPDGGETEEEEAGSDPISGNGRPGPRCPAYTPSRRPCARINGIIRP